MKLFCFTHNSSIFYQRPDTAIEKPMEDFFVPDFCTQLSFCPIIVIKINKLGRSVQKKFANRYYSQFSYGTALFAQNLLDDARSSGLPWDQAVAMDYSLPINKEFIDKALYKQFSNFICEITHCNGERDLMRFELPSQERIELCIEQLSHWVYVKMGDLVCIELCEPIMLQRGETLQAYPTLCDKTAQVATIDFKIR